VYAARDGDFEEGGGVNGFLPVGERVLADVEMERLSAIIRKVHYISGLMPRLRSILLLTAVSFLRLSPVWAQVPVAYAKEVEAWHAERIADLRAADGWLDLVGLYWLQEGRNSFGSALDNTIVFPFGTISPSAGFFQRTGDSVSMHIMGVSGVTVDGRPSKDAIIFNKDSLRQPTVAIGSLRFSIIRRGDKLGVRLRDLNSPAMRSFKDVPRYPVDTAWRIPAVLQRAGAPASIAITNVLGQTSQQKSPGKLVFTYRGSQYTLETMEEDDGLFIVFADGTTGKTTYQAGRFVHAQMPTGADGTTVIDFNKAYNPPCAFTSFATCPLPPKGNVLPVDVEAGEKNIGH
jgi:uncharacterized protein (DUF1684 family)